MSRSIFPHPIRSLALGAFAVWAGACGDATGSDRAAGVTVEGDWPVITGNLMGQRYSPLMDIDRQNVGDIERAWTYRLRPNGGGGILAGAAKAVLSRAAEGGANYLLFRRLGSAAVRYLRPVWPPL